MYPLLFFMKEGASKSHNIACISLKRCPAKGIPNILDLSFLLSWKFTIKDL